MKKFLATVLIILMIVTICPLGMFNFTASADAGTSSNTNFNKLKNYISSYGSTGSDGYKTVIDVDYSGDFTYYFVLKNKGSGIYFDLLTTSNKSTYIGTNTEFVLYPSSKTISVEFMMLYYYAGSCVDGVEDVINIDRSTYTSTKTYTSYESGKYISSSDFTKSLNTTLELLCKFWDVNIYDELGFGLKGLGFVSYSGKGTTACDSPSSYHKGTTVIKNYKEAGCVTSGYTGDKYCSYCNEKISSGSTISSKGGHKYDNSCDADCNVCGQKRSIVHTYDNACDHDCNVCDEEREVPDHTYNDNCDSKCNECEFEREAPHTYDDSKDLICNSCGYERPPYTPGDLDDNDEITDRDAVHLLYHTFLPDLYPVNQDCDFNGDGEVNDKDAVYLLYYTFLPDLYPID